MSSRLDQMEAASVDAEMTAILKEKLVDMFSLMKPGMLLQYEPEVDALTEFVIWRFTTWVDKPTHGNAMMNLRFRDESGPDTARNCSTPYATGVGGPGLTANQKLWYYIATVGGQYVWARLQSFFAFRRWGDLEQRPLLRRAWFCLQRIVGIYKAVSLGNLLVFLYAGKYRNLVERVLKIRLVYGSPDMNLWVGMDTDVQSVCYEDMQLLLIPFLDSPLIKNLLHSFSKGLSPDSAGHQILCPICGSNPTISFVALPCQHRYCYYCLQTQCSATPSYHCVKCSEPVTAMQRYVGSR